jgi:hypothetical protein
MRALFLCVLLLLPAQSAAQSWRGPEAAQFNEMLRTYLERPAAEILEC